MSGGLIDKKPVRVDIGAKKKNPDINRLQRIRKRTHLRRTLKHLRTKRRRRIRNPLNFKLFGKSFRTLKRNTTN